MSTTFVLVVYDQSDLHGSHFSLTSTIAPTFWSYVQHLTKKKQNPTSVLTVVRFRCLHLDMKTAFLERVLVICIGGIAGGGSQWLPATSPVYHS
jgi:hypothetical protein